MLPVHHAVHPDTLTLELGERYLLALLESRLDQRQERIGPIAIGIKFAHILV